MYVGSADSEKYDQTLDSVLVGPVEMGRNKFVFQANAPDHKLIPVNDLLGVTVVMLICSYKKQEFIRVGYYVNNEYDTMVSFIFIFNFIFIFIFIYFYFNLFLFYLFYFYFLFYLFYFFKFIFYLGTKRRSPCSPKI